MLDINAALLSLQLALNTLSKEMIPGKGGSAAAQFLGDIWGTQGDADNAEKVGLVYASHEKIPLTRFRDNFLNKREVAPKKFILMGGNPTTGQGSELACWLYVPHFNDFVLVGLGSSNKPPKDEVAQIRASGEQCLRVPGIIAYIDSELELVGSNGLFYWYSTWESAGFNHLGVNKLGAVSACPLAGKGDYDNKNRHPNDRAVREWVYRNIIDRDQVFEYLMCMREEEFKRLLDVEKKLDVAKARIKFSSLYNSEHGKPFKDFFSSEPWKRFNAVSVSSLRAKFRRSVPGRTGKLFVLKWADNKYGKRTDIRYLQSHFKTGNPTFQIASTFSCLEGDVQNYLILLDAMNKRPVQGENAVLAALLGAIVRRYFISAEERNLVGGLVGILAGAGRHQVPRILGIAENYTYERLLKSVEAPDITGFSKENLLDLALSGAFKVGAHRDIYVTGGSMEWDIEIPRDDAPFIGDPSKVRQKPAFDKNLTKGKNKVHHIYTAAIDLNERHVGEVAKMKLSDKKFWLAKQTLRASYEGTILAAWEIYKTMSFARGTAKDIDDFLDESRDMPRLFLTLVGGGAFQNDPMWIVNILKQLQALIYASGLQICVVVRGTPKSDWLNELEKLSKTINSANSIQELSDNAAKLDEVKGFSPDQKPEKEVFWIWDDKALGGWVNASINSFSAVDFPFKFKASNGTEKPIALRIAN